MLRHGSYHSIEPGIKSQDETFVTSTVPGSSAEVDNDRHTEHTLVVETIDQARRLSRGRFSRSVTYIVLW